PALAVCPVPWGTPQFCLCPGGATLTLLPLLCPADDEVMATDVTPPASAELTELGKCLMKQEDVCTAMLITAYTSLSWKDTLSCQRTTTQLCWPLLKQVLAGNLLPDAVSWFFTSVLRGLQMHGQHDGCMAALVHLAFQIYEALRPRYAELKVVMEQIPDLQRESLEQFESKLLNPTLQKVADKRRKDHFKRLIAGCIGVGDILAPLTAPSCAWEASLTVPSRSLSKQEVAAAQAILRNTESILLGLFKRE
uniref:Exportin-5 C-terminal domain-containing protein n=1 Tax=Nothoprocta perdicaria TaxID=30464 RepID=A0A8C6ZCB3_NOTPE